MTPETIIYAVFDADGCECKNFEGAFSTYEKANAFADELRRKDAEWGAIAMENDGFVMSPKIITVEPVALDHPGREFGEFAGKPSTISNAAD